MCVSASKKGKKAELSGNGTAEIVAYCFKANLYIKHMYNLHLYNAVFTQLVQLQ